MLKVKVVEAKKRKRQQKKSELTHTSGEIFIDKRFLYTINIAFILFVLFIEKRDSYSQDQEQPSYSWEILLSL